MAAPFPDGRLLLGGQCFGKELVTTKDLRLNVAEARSSVDRRGANCPEALCSLGYPQDELGRCSARLVLVERFHLHVGLLHMCIVVTLAVALYATWVTLGLRSVLWPY